MQNVKLDFSNVLIQPQSSELNSRSEVVLECTKSTFKHCPRTWTGVPIIAANMDTTGTFKVYGALSKHKIITALHKFYTVADYKTAHEEFDLHPDYFMVSVGVHDDELEKLKNIHTILPFKWICIDIANGYIPKLLSFCQKVRKTFPGHIIVAGNVVTPERVSALLNHGVDVVKVGIGPGAACTTRIQTGVGMPQLSAIQECATAAHAEGGMIIGDGGITCPGDMAKAFGGGADFVMAGSLFAGHDENPGAIIEEQGQKYKLFYGMSSRKAMETHYGKMANYRSSEGRALKMKYKGKLEDTVLNYLGGLRSTCTYINAKCIDEMEDKTTFVYVSQQANFSLVR